MANEMLADLDEMTHRYARSMISHINKKGKREPFEVHRFYVQDEKGNIVVDDTDGNTYPEDEIDLDRPTLGVFNVGKTVKHISMPPVRQWRRGLVFKNLILVDRLEHEALLAGHGRSTQRTVIKSIYDCEYLSVKDALTEVMEYKALARAFSPKFYFGIRQNGSNVVVFYKKWIIGWVEGDVIKLRSHHLYEELSEFMKVEKI